MKRNNLCLLFVLLAVPFVVPFTLPGGQAYAEGPGVCLLLDPPKAPIIQGQKGILTIALVDVSGTPTAAEKDLTIELVADPDLLTEQQTVLKAGETRVEVQLEPTRAGVWVIQAIARGVFDETALVVSMSSEVAGDDTPQDETPRSVGTLAETEGVGTGTSLLTPPSRAPLEPVEAERILIDKAGVRPDLAARVTARRDRIQLPDHLTSPGADVEEATEGHLVLKPTLTTVRRGPDGMYKGPLFVLWFEGESPNPRREDLEVELFFEPSTSDRVAIPQMLSLPAGQVSSRLEIRSDSVGEVQVLALYGQRISDPVKVRFLPPKPTTLAFPRASYTLRGLASAQLDAVVQLLDDRGAILLAETKHKVSLLLEGEGGIETHELEILPGEFQATAKLRVSRFGEHTLRALSPGLKPALATAHFRLDNLLLLVALLGGMVGSVARLLFTRRGKDWKKGLARAVALGVVAALLALLLALFQVLKVIEDILAPGLGSALSGLPFQNPLAVFLIGLIAGLGLETLLGFFTGWRAKVAAGAPAKEEHGTK